MIMNKNLYPLLFALCLTWWESVDNCTPKDSKTKEKNKGVKCGIANDGPAAKRIIGGQVVKPPHKYPWMISIQKPNENNTYVQACGGTIISDTCILTAGHCVEIGDTNRNLKVYAGLFDQNQLTAAKRLNVKKVIKFPHENFRDIVETPKFDFALIKLAKPIRFNQNIRPICLPASNEWIDYQGDAIALGWGFTELGWRSKTSRYLREIKLPFIPNSKCNISMTFKQEIFGNITLPPDVTELFNKTFILDAATTASGNETMVCVGYKDGPARKTNYADSGGPLVMQGKDGVFTQVGIASWVNPFEPGPSVFSRVSYAVDWIKDFM